MLVSYGDLHTIISIMVMEVTMSIPNDPMMLLSFVNLKLRDYYSSLNAMCDDMELDINEITKKLASIDYEYDSELNKFC